MSFDKQDISRLCGWNDDGGHVVIAATMPKFHEAARALMGDTAPSDVLLYKAWFDVLGKEPAYPAQEIGDCTSFGSGHAVDLLECIQISLGHKSEAFKEICTEAIYGMGRDIAGMHFGDGCYGGAVAKAVMEGVIPREEVGPYSGSRARSWGRSGAPADVVEKCKKHPVKATALVQTTAELDAAIANGYPVIVCSNQGFTMTRDETGLCRASGSWSHCMHINAYRTRNGEKQYCIGQSWGPNTPSGPQVDGQPSFSFWAASRTVGSMLSGGDSFAFSAFDGFPGQPLPSAWSYSNFI